MTAVWTGKPWCTRALRPVLKVKRRQKSEWGRIHALPVGIYLHDLIFSPQLFDKVVSVLDPDMCVNSASSLPTPTAHQAEEEEEKNCKEPSEDDVHRAKQGTPANELQVHWEFDW